MTFTHLQIALITEEIISDRDLWLPQNQFVEILHCTTFLK